MLLSTPELRRWDAYWMLIVLVGKLAWNIEFWRKEACCFMGSWESHPKAAIMNYVTSLD
jgi:hypothetical protein